MVWNKKEKDRSSPQNKAGTITIKGYKKEGKKKAGNKVPRHTRIW